MKNKLKRLLQYLEEQKKLDYQNCDIDAQPVEQLSFVFKNKQYVVVDVYENSYYADELNDEVVEYHFTAQLADQYGDEIFELVYDSLEQCFFIQSENKIIREHFLNEAFEQAGSNHFFRVLSELVDFNIAGQKIRLDDIDLQLDKTPEDYSAKKHPVYFAIGGKRQGLIKPKSLLEMIPFIQVQDISETEYGFILSICIQQIPEVVSLLVARKWAVYEVKVLS